MSVDIHISDYAFGIDEYVIIYDPAIGTDTETKRGLYLETGGHKDVG